MKKMILALVLTLASLNVQANVTCSDIEQNTSSHDAYIAELWISTGGENEYSKYFELAVQVWCGNTEELGTLKTLVEYGYLERTQVLALGEYLKNAQWQRVQVLAANLQGQLTQLSNK
jgi:hypothetical protein